MPTETHHAKLFRFSWSVRAMVLTLTGLSLAFGLIAYGNQRIRKHREIVLEIEQLGGTVHYSQTRVPKRLVDWMGIDYFENVEEVRLCGDNLVTDGRPYPASFHIKEFEPIIGLLRKLPELQSVQLYSRQKLRINRSSLNFLGYIRLLEVQIKNEFPDVEVAGVEFGR